MCQSNVEPLIQVFETDGSFIFCTFLIFVKLYFFPECIKNSFWGLTLLYNLLNKEKKTIIFVSFLVKKFRLFFWWRLFELNYMDQKIFRRFK